MTQQPATVEVETLRMEKAAVEPQPLATPVIEPTPTEAVSVEPAHEQAFAAMEGGMPQAVAAEAQATASMHEQAEHAESAVQNAQVPEAGATEESTSVASAETFAIETPSVDAEALPDSEAGVIKQVYVVQLGAYRYLSKAARELETWRAKGYEPYVREYRRANGRVWFKLLAGNYAGRDEAAALAAGIESKEGVRPLVAALMTGKDGKPRKVVDVTRLAEKEAR
jgi:cell division septation protein DedD